MEMSVIKKFLYACHEAKRITELLPELPPGMTPRHIHVIDALWQLEQSGAPVKVSDISDLLNVTRPGITKMISELEKIGAVRKLQDKTDRRVVRISLTESGRECYGFYVEQYQTWMAERISDSGIDSREIEAASELIGKIYRIMNPNRMEDILK